MEHTHCLKEGDLATIKAEVSDLKKIVKGNGQKGLQQIVTELNTTLPQLTESVDNLSDKVQSLLDRKIGDDVERALKLSAKQKLTAIVSGIIGAATVIVMIADMIINK
jgi:predicted PurR-regulated permease PerM